MYCIVLYGMPLVGPSTLLLCLALTYIKFRSFFFYRATMFAALWPLAEGSPIWKVQVLLVLCL